MGKLREAYRCPLLAMMDNVRWNSVSLRLRFPKDSSTFLLDDPARQFVKREISFAGECMLPQDLKVGWWYALSIRPRLQESECSFDKFPGIHTGAKSVGASKGNVNRPLERGKFVEAHPANIHHDLRGRFHLGAILYTMLRTQLG